MATATAKAFRSQGTDNDLSRQAQAIRDANWALFGHFASPGYNVEDFDMTVRHIRSLTGFQPQFIKSAILGHAALQELPQVRALQEETRLLDIAHLTAINSGLEEMGPDPDPEFFAELDNALIDVFTPKRNNQELPQRTKVTRRIRDLIKRLDPARAYNPKRRAERTQNTDTVAFDTFLSNGEERAIMQMCSDAARMDLAHQSVLATARELGVSMLEAAFKLLTGEVTPTAPVLNIYAPKDRQAGQPFYLPGTGWTSPEATVTLEEWLENTAPKVVDLDDAATRELAGYAPSPAMKAAAVARDGTCIFPGCTVSAHRCQLDHRIPYEEGGKTAVSNLFSLCQKHHNVKTDRRAFYVPDPVTGEITWLFADGTYTVVEPEGVLFDQLTPTNPRWQSSLQSVRANRALAAEFNAKGHAILDRCEEREDPWTAKEHIAELEAEYGMIFPVKVVIPDVELPVPCPIEPMPVEPDFDDPPYPDPEYHYPDENPFHTHPSPAQENLDWLLPVYNLTIVDDVIWTLLEEYGTEFCCSTYTKANRTA